MPDARGVRPKGSKQGFTTENIEDHGAVRILYASRGRVIWHRAKRRDSLLRGPRGPPMFSVLKTCLSCRRSTETNRPTEVKSAITTVRPAVQDKGGHDA
jgi:hypothetical protein